MRKRKNRKTSWLLTVASAYSALPGCGDDTSQESGQVGIIVAPHDASTIDAGKQIRPPDATISPGVAIRPPADAATDAATDAAGHTAIGLVVEPAGDPCLDAGFILNGIIACRTQE